MAKIETKHAVGFVHDVISDLGPLSLTDIPAVILARMPRLSVLMQSVREGSGVAAGTDLASSRTVPWLNVMNSWEPHWGKVLNVEIQEAITCLKVWRLQCLIDLAQFLDDQFKFQVFSLAEANGRNPADFWFYQLKGEFLRETVVKGGLMPGQCPCFIDGAYAYVRKG
jgi:hypothetical protein